VFRTQDFIANDEDATWEDVMVLVILALRRVEKRLKRLAEQD